MASVSIQLTHPNSEISSIVFQIRDGQAIKIKVPAKLSVKPKHWKKGKVHSADNLATVKNQHLEKYKNRVLEIYLEAKRNGIKPNAKYIKEALAPKIDRSTLEDSFWSLWDDFLEAKKSRYSKRSFVKFNSLKKHLEKFELINRSSWDVHRLNSNELEKFQTWMFESNLSTSTVSKYIGVFKMFLNWVIENGFTKNTDFRKFTPVRPQDTLKVILTDEEIERIKATKFEGGGYLANAKDLLLLSVHTGLRYSDYSRIRKEHLKEDSDRKPVLLIRQQKTKEILEIPLTYYSLALVKRLINGELRSVSNQNLNQYIKEVCRIAAIDEPFEVHRFKGKLEVTTYRPKWELITTHVGRRTFATKLLRKGFDAIVVMDYTGHRDYKSFTKYVNIPKSTKHRMVREALGN